MIARAETYDRAVATPGGFVDFAVGAPVRGDLEVRWIHGSPRGRPNDDPAFQVHRYDPHTYVLRQSKALTAEAPFLYLLFGNDRAVLLDTGAVEKTVENPLRSTIDGLVDTWLAEHPRESYQLVVAHTHGHSDHVAGDGQFTDRPATTIVDRELPPVQEFFGFASWPEEIVEFDLGGRVLEMIGTPGHQRAALTIYDPWSGFLLTGDNVLPGRIYAFDFPAYLDSMERTVEFATSRQVTQVMGCHIEMTRQAGRDYPLGCTYQPDEPPLQMTLQELVAVRDAARSIENKPGVHTFDDFLILNGKPRRYIVKLLARALWAKVRPPA
jgi:glyoxylase-like metal-dependent hydrolase (beta-lactamase superfamily II)